MPAGPHEWHTACVPLTPRHALALQEGGSQDPDLHTAETSELRGMLADKEAAAAAAETRIARLEALHKLAQDSALQCEAELTEMQEALVKGDLDHQRLVVDLQQSRCALCDPATLRIVWQLWGAPAAWP